MWKEGQRGRGKKGAAEQRAGEKWAVWWFFYTFFKMFCGRKMFCSCISMNEKNKYEMASKLDVWLMKNNCKSVSGFSFLWELMWKWSIALWMNQFYLTRCGCSKRLTANRCQSLVFPNRAENVKRLVQRHKNVGRFNFFTFNLLAWSPAVLKHFYYFTSHIGDA